MTDSELLEAILSKVNGIETKSNSVEAETKRSEMAQKTI